MGIGLRKSEKFYRKIVMRNIGIFVFIGISEVVFGPGGWLPNGDIYAISLYKSEKIGEKGESR